MSKPMLFKNIKTHTAFTPAAGEVGERKVYVKKENGICPVVSRDNRWTFDPRVGGTYQDEGIFHPFDKVHPVNVPPKILYFYR